MPRSVGVGDQRLFLAFVLIAIALTTLSSADCKPSYNDSLASAQDVPGGFQSFTCEGMMPAKYAISGCLGLVSDTCLESVVPDVVSLNASLTVDEASNFSRAINDMSRAANSTIQAQMKRNDLLFSGFTLVHKRSCTATSSFINDLERLIGSPIDNFIDESNSTSNVSLSPFIPSQSSLDQGIINCVLSGIFADGTAKDIIYNERSALEAASMGLNSAMDVLQNETDQLYCEGGGYDDHSLAATVTYDKVRNLINASNTQTISGFSDFGMRWASLCGNMQLLKSWYASSGVTDCRTANILNSALGKNSVFLQLVDMFREVRDARQQLKADFVSANLSASEQFQYAMQARKRMQDNQYGLVNARVVSYFRDVANDPSAVIPSESFLLVDGYLNSTGTSPGANILIAEANKTIALKEQFYYAIAIKKLNDAERLSTESIRITNTTDIFVSSLLVDAERITSAKRASAESAISSFIAKGGFESVQQQLAIKRFNDTDNDYMKEETRTGVRLRTLMNASMRYDEAADIVSSKGIILASSVDSLSQSIQNLNSVISLAKSDSVNTYDAELLAKNKALLSQYSNTTTEMADSARAELDAMASQLYTRASQQYSDLPSKRKVVIQTIDALSEAPGTADMTQMRSNVSYLEGFVYANGSFIPDKMLGKYKSARTTYDSILNELSKRISDVLKSYLPKKTKVIKTYQTVPVVDSAGAVTTSITIVNDLPINSSSPVTVSIPNVPVNVNSNFTFDQNGVRAAASGTGIDVYLSDVAEMSTYTVTVVTPYRVAELQKKSTNRVSLTQYELIEKTDYTINVKDDLDSLTLNDATSADDCKAYLNGKEHPLLFIEGNFSARFSPAYSGTLQASVVCTTFNPMEVIESNSTVVNNSLDYLFSVRSRKSSLENVIMTLTLKSNPNLIIPMSIRVTDEAGDSAPKDFSYSLTGGNYVVKWTIPILSDSFQVYRVFYTTTDIDQYYNELKSQVGVASAVENVDVSTYVQDAEYRASVGNYADATESLRRAQKAIEQGRNDRLQREAVSVRLSAVAGKLSAVKNESASILSIASELNMPDAIFELNKQLAEFDSKKAQADLFISMNDTGSALSAVKDMERMAESTSLDKAFYSKQESLFKSLSKQKSTSFALSAFGDTTDLVTTIESAENLLKSVSVDVASGSYSSAITTMSNVSSSVSSVDKLLSNRTGSVESEASAILSEAKSAIARWKSLKDGVVNSLKINADNPGTRVDIASLSASLSDTDKTATELSTLYDKLKQYGAGDILLNIAEFRQLKSESSDVSDGSAYLDGIRNDYKTNAQESLNDTRAFIDQRMSNASADEKQVLTSLQPLLITAKDSYDSGLYLDSMVLTDHIKNRIASYTATPQPLVDPLVIYVAIVVLASAAVVVLLFRKEEPKSPRLIERVKLD
jgi:hypothetical protein